MGSLEKPTILLVHGAWHRPAHLEPVRQLLESQSFPVICPALPTVDPKTLNLSFNDDVKAVQIELDALVVRKGKEVIVVMHSYAGVVGTEAVHERYSKKIRQEGGLCGGVTQLLFLCAFVVPEGASLLTPMGGEQPPFVTVKEDGTCWMQEPERRFYNDLTKEQQDRWIGELRRCLASAHAAPLTYVAWKYYPVAYLYCENDQTLPLEFQQKMVTESGVKFATYTCSSGHSPFLSQPETVVKVLDSMVTAA